MLILGGIVKKPNRSLFFNRKFWRAAILGFMVTEIVGITASKSLLNYV